MIKARSHFVRINWRRRNRLRHQCTIMFQDRRTQSGPDQPFRESEIAGVEGVQVGIGLPVFEQ